MISIIIPSYNSEKQISRAITSILDQTYQNIEIIIVDDGSKDKTKEVVDGFNDKRIKYIYQENAGPSKARNTGIALASGEYIAFLDADDSFMPKKLEKGLIELSKDNIGMVYNSFVVTPEGKESSLVKFKKMQKTEYISRLITDPFNYIAFPSTVMIKKDLLLEAGGFDTTLKIGEDWDLWLKIYPKTTVKYIDLPLTQRFTTINSITRTIDFNTELKTHEKILSNFFDNNICYEALKNKALSMIYYNHASRHFYKSNKKINPTVLTYTLKSIKLDPTILIKYPKIFKFMLNVFFKYLKNNNQN